MNLHGLLSIGQNGMSAATSGTSLASHNASNAQTEGYTRRSMDLEAVRLDYGGGARVKTPLRVTDPFLDRRALNAETYAGEGEARATTLQILDTVLADDSGNVGPALDAFESAVADVASHPSEPAARSQLLQRTAELADAFSRSAQSLDQARVDANGFISHTIRDVNDNLQSIASLNQQIVEGHNAGRDVGDYIDRRDSLVRSVAKALPISTLPHDDGSVTVTLAGSLTLVSEDGRALPLVAATEPTSGDVRIYREIAGAMEDVTSMIHSGSVGGTISARDGALADARGRLDQLAFDFATAYNTQHAAGRGSDDVVGRNLFDVSATVDGAAYSLGVSADVAGFPERIAAAANVGAVAEDGLNAAALMGLRDARFADGGSATAQESLSSLIADGGIAVRSARDTRQHADASLQQVRTLRDSISGVSSDEEMLSLMKFQRSYQASVRVIQTADSMLEELINLKR